MNANERKCWPAIKAQELITKDINLKVSFETMVKAEFFFQRMRINENVFQGVKNAKDIIKGCYQLRVRS